MNLFQKCKLDVQYNQLKYKVCFKSITEKKAKILIHIRIRIIFMQLIFANISAIFLQSTTIHLSSAYAFLNTLQCSKFVPSKSIFLVKRESSKEKQI